MKTALFHQRLIAKAIDFSLVIFASRNENAFGVILSIIYLLICDGFFQGQSIGKRIVGLKTVYFDSQSKEYLTATYAQSAVRNGIFSALILVSIIPLIGGILAPVLAVISAAIEIYFMYTDPERLRIGDIYAKTKVVQIQYV